MGTPANVPKIHRAEDYRRCRGSDLHTAHEAIPGDHPFMTFARRTSCLKQEPPPANWDDPRHLERE
jgi:hypothetical protein